MPGVDRSSFSRAPVCVACGTQYPEAEQMTECPVCRDERQYVGWAGQRWTTTAEIAADHQIRFEDAAGVMTMALQPEFAIGQRAFLIPQEGGMVMWECLPAVTDAALERIAGLGGVQAIAISHPHFYSAMHEWSAALGGVPIYLHEADEEWVRHDSPFLRFWDGEHFTLTGALDLVHLPGHFAGSTGLWWKNGPRPGGSLFPGDALYVVMDRRFVSFMRSYPNLIPLGPKALGRLEAKIGPLAFTDLYSAFEGREIIGDAMERVAASFARYRDALKG
ncbi:MBL fold metallo-hydrolase [Pleomorphomonas sp. PLEO]|uniref:MBL fold metallo-hydrolase n=1 Tax=Pleomorphomonas sp. PLEO TaxID=3239306 RepID=UPI00351DFD2B